MKNKIIGLLLLAALLLLGGCQNAQQIENEINIINAGSTEDVTQEDNSTVIASSSASSAKDSQPSLPNSEASTSAESKQTSTPDLNETIEPLESITAPSSQASDTRTAVPQTSYSTEDCPKTSTQDATTSPSTVPQATTSTTTIAATSAETEPTEIPDFSENEYTALNHDEVRGVWISYIELAEMLTGKTAQQFKASIEQAFDNCTALGLNTIYVHARSHGDAYYNSTLFPQSKYVTGVYGKAADFDPLEIMIEQAHARGLSIHAWINPLRCCAVSDISGAKGTLIYEWANNSETSGKYIVNVNGTYYLNPAYKSVTNLIAAGAAEIAANYDVDGVHIDDYFYPTTDAGFDSEAFAESGYDILSSFRFANCDRLVSGLYSAIKNANTSALFGVSCQGSLENNYNQMYADVKKWIANDGYLDYIMPQIYYGFDNSTQPYEKCTSEWDELSTAGGKPLIIGLSVSKIGSADAWAGAGKNEWITDKNILSRQFSYAAEKQSYGGICLYSYRSVFSPESSVKSQVEEEINALKALFE